MGRQLASQHDAMPVISARTSTDEEVSHAYKRHLQMQTDTLVKLINHAEDMLQLDADREVVEYEEEEGLINAND